MDELVDFAEHDQTTPDERTLALDLMAAVRDANDDLTHLLQADIWPTLFLALSLQLTDHPKRWHVIRDLLAKNHFAHDERYAALRAYLSTPPSQ